MDTYMSHINCSERLLREWLKHDKIVIAVDFDDTIHDFHNQCNDYRNVIWLLREVSGYAYIFCHTASPYSRYNEIVNKFKELEIPLYGINDSPVKLHKDSHTKPYANLYMDDRAGLYSSYAILKMAYEKYKEYKGGNCNTK